MFPSLYILILYITLSPLFTVNGFFGCTLLAVVVSPLTSLVNSDASICGVLSIDGAWPFIDIINFLNAKSKYFFSSFITVLLSEKSTFSFSTLTTGWSLVGSGFSTDQYVDFVVVYEPDISSLIDSIFALIGIEI